MREACKHKSRHRPVGKFCEYNTTHSNNGVKLVKKKQHKFLSITPATDLPYNHMWHDMTITQIRQSPYHPKVHAIWPTLSHWGGISIHSSCQVSLKMHYSDLPQAFYSLVTDFLCRFQQDSIIKNVTKAFSTNSSILITTSIIKLRSKVICIIKLNSHSWFMLICFLSFAMLDAWGSEIHLYHVSEKAPC